MNLTTILQKQREEFQGRFFKDGEFAPKLYVPQGELAFIADLEAFLAPPSEKKESGE